MTDTPLVGCRYALLPQFPFRPLLKPKETRILQPNSKSMATKFTLPKCILAVMAVGILLSMLVIGFFIGRLSTHKDRNQETSLVEAVVSPPYSEPEIAQLPSREPEQLSVEAPGSATEPAIVASAKSSSDFKGTSELSLKPAEPPSEAIESAVAAYFSDIDQIQPGQMGADASEVANKIIVGLSGGDASALNSMIDRGESARNRLEAITPPPPCATHYQLSLACLDSGLKMLHAIKQAVASIDADGLFTLATQANAMLSCSEVLKNEDKAIRERYGLNG